MIYYLLTIFRIGLERSLTFLPYGNQQRKHSRLMHEGLSPNALLSYRRSQEYEATVLLREIMETPDAFLTHVKR
jgi:hypothetical protein